MKNFYEHQEVARSNSAGMMLLLSLAMFLTTLATGFVLTVSTFGPWYYCVHLHYRETIASMIPVLGQLELVGPNHGAEIHETFPWMLAGFWFGVLTLATGTGIILVTRAKMTRLRQRGGIGVAESLGAICISDGKHQQDLDCRKTVNIVEEMAIAAGIRPPTVYLLLGEPGINAFALGFQPEDTVIGLTDGAVKTLNREQLQGVVAHEFSHIANGDIKTNLRLIGYLHGILAVILMSQHLIRGGVELFVKSATYGASGAWALLLVVMGILLWPVGLSGLLCAAVVKAAATSRHKNN